MSVEKQLPLSSDAHTLARAHAHTVFPKIMGILNITPDSFYDGGAHEGEKAVAHFDRLAAEGADCIDIGAESSRPGSQRIPVEEELARLRSFFEIYASRPTSFTSRPLLSIDTMKSAVARYALEHGAAIVNDISALRFDPEGMLKALADYPQSRLVVMHMQGTPETMQFNPVYEDVTAEICVFFEERLRFLEDHGIGLERIILDPGIGFGKTLEHNMEILARLPEIKRAFGLDLLVGASRKSMIGAILGGVPPSERLEGTLAAHLFAFEQGADWLRVHDVASTRRALAVWKKLQSVKQQKISHA